MSQKKANPTRGSQTGLIRASRLCLGRWIGWIAALVVIAGCGSGDVSKDESSTNAGISADEVAAMYGYAVDGAEYTPAYALVPELGDPDLSYARLLLIQQCMAGIYQMDLRRPSPATESVGQQSRSKDRIFTVELVSRWGYHLPPPQDPGSRTVVLDTSLSEEQVLQKQEECNEPVVARLGDIPEKFLMGVVEAGRAAVESSSAVKDAAAEWNQCMKPVGVIDLPDTPTGMPSPSVAGAMDPKPDSAPSPMEISIAVSDATCRASSGYSDAVFAARAHAELAAIGKDIESFEAAREANAAYGVKAQDVINELG